jgi:hypothetical protein
MPLEHTGRGIAIYADLKDTYGADVHVIESSAAQIEGEDRGPWVWIYAAGGAVTGNDGAAHLDIRDAVKIRDGLTEFIDSHGGSPGVRR